MKSIANNEKIDEMHQASHSAISSALDELNRALSGHHMPCTVSIGGRKGSDIDFTATNKNVTLPSGEEVPASALLEWEVPHEAPDDWPQEACQAHKHFWGVCTKRRQQIDECIVAGADFEHLYDKPYVDKKKVRVAGPFTVESLTPHRSIETGSSTDDEHIENESTERRSRSAPSIPAHDFRAIMLEQLQTAGVQQPDKRSKITFTSLQGWPGDLYARKAPVKKERSRSAQAF